MHFHLGKVFISHTAADKPFVRRLAKRLAREQFRIWLDEHDLVAGDPLPESIGKALSSARVVLVVVSKASVASKWLRYELNIATERMIKGECRVIPIVTDNTALPSEVQGLLYADCRKSLTSGIPAILTALKYESRRASLDGKFYARIDHLVQEVFGGMGYVSLGGYRSQDYKVVSFPGYDPDGKERERDAFYETISHYLKDTRPEPLTDSWFSEFLKATEDFTETLSLLVTERPVAFRVDSWTTRSKNVGVRRLTSKHLGFNYRQIVVVDLTNIHNEAEQKAALEAARELLIRCGEGEIREAKTPRAGGPHSRSRRRS